MADSRAVVQGKREGYGTSRYDGKFGYDQWVGPFEDDKPHGEGIMFLADGGGSEPFSFVRGEPMGEPRSSER